MIEDRRLGKDGNIYNFDIDKNPPNVAKVVTKHRWGDVDGNWGRIPYQLRVWGDKDQLENKFPETADPEPPGDADANTPLPFDPTTLIPQEIIEKAKVAIGLVATTAEAAFTQSKGLLETLLAAQDANTDLDNAMNNLKALIAQSKRKLNGESDAVPITIEKPKYSRRLDSNGELQSWNIDKTKPFRDVTETIRIRDLEAEELEFNNETVPVRVYGELALLDQYYPLSS